MYIYIYITRTPPVGAGRVPRRYVDDVGEGAPRRDHRHDHVVLRAVPAIRVILSESYYPSHAAARRVRGHDVMTTLSCALLGKAIVVRSHGHPATCFFCAHEHGRLVAVHNGRGVQGRTVSGA